MRWVPMVTICTKGVYVSILVDWMSRILALGRVASQDKCIFRVSLLGLLEKFEGRE